MRYAFILVLLLLLAGCNGVQPSPANQPRIVPETCLLSPHQSIELSLNGVIAPGVRILWQSNGGTILQTTSGITATYTAPEQPGIYRVTVLIYEPGKSAPTALNELVCTVNAAPTESVALPFTPTAFPTPTASLPSTPSPTPSPTFTPTPEPKYTLAITEFMGNPCGPDEINAYNQYVELYNYGPTSVDVSSLWLYSEGNHNPDQLVAWDAHEPRLPSLDKEWLTNTTSIPPGKFAVILSPTYTSGPVPYFMPYTFPKGTVILTVKDNRLGDGYPAILASGKKRDVLVLYRGGRTVVEKVISTYGSPMLDPFVAKIRDDYRDAIPFDLPECSSANLLTLAKGDIQSNWRIIRYGTPGEGPYPKP